MFDDKSVLWHFPAVAWFGGEPSGLGESQAERPEPHLQLQSSKDLVHKFIVAFDLFLGLMDLFAKLCRDIGERKQGHDLRSVTDKYFFKVH